MDLDKLAEIFLVANDYISDSTGSSCEIDKGSCADVLSSVLARMIFRNKSGEYRYVDSRSLFCRIIFGYNSVEDSTKKGVENSFIKSKGSNYLSIGYTDYIYSSEEANALIEKHIAECGYVYIGQKSKP